MPAAQIIFHQPSGDGYLNPGSRDDLVLYDGTNATKITVQNLNDTGVTSWMWTIVDKPTGSTAVFASSGTITSTSNTDTFNPDVVGTYLIKLKINNNTSLVDQKGAAVKTLKLNYRIPAANESIEFDGYRGWATAVNSALKLLDDGYSAGGNAIDNIAALRSSTAYASNNMVNVLGYYSPGDLGGGLFFWSASSSLADDGGMIIKPTSISGSGRWIRVLSTPAISVKQYGALENGANDLGVFINAVDGYFGSNGGTIIVPDGYYILNTQAHISSNHTLQLGKCDIATLTASVTPIVYDSNTEIAGVGWNSIIREPANDWFTTIQGYAMTINNSGDAESNVYLHDFQVQGPYATSFNSAPSAIACGNAHNVIYERIWFNSTKSIGLDIGGFSDLGFHASEIWIKDCLFTHVASQNIGVTNARTFHIIGNTFKNSGQVSGPGSSYIDCEMNGANDVIIDFEICNNLFDAYGGANPGNCILVQSTQIPGAWPTHCGPGIISNNTILGGETDAVPAEIASGVFLSQANEINIVGNVMKRLTQNAISINGSTYCNATGNLVISVAGGGIHAIDVVTSTHCAVNGNYISFDNSANAGGSSVALVEDNTSDFNRFENNIFQWGSATAPVSLITLGGANSTASNNSSNGRSIDYTSRYIPTTTITTSRSILLSDNVIFVDTTTGVITLTLPDATDGAFATQTGMTGRGFRVKRIAGANNIVLQPGTVGQTVDGAASITISDNLTMPIQSDGANWHSMR